MNFILRKNGFPMINLPNVRKREYCSALQEGQVKANLRPFIDLIRDIYRKRRLSF